MSRKTRPVQFREAQNAVLPHLRSDDACRVFNDANGNPLFVAYGRPGADDEREVWQIRQIVYDENGNPSEILFPVEPGAQEPSNDYIFAWNGGVSFSVTGITQADPGVVTVGDIAGLQDGDVVSFVGVGGMVEVNRQLFIVAEVDDNTDTFELTDMNGDDVDTAGFGAYTSGGTVVLFNAFNYRYA